MNIIVKGLMAIFVLCFCILCLNRMNIINAPHLIVSYYIASHRIASIKCSTTRAVGRSENPWGRRLFWRRRLCFYYCKNQEGQHNLPPLEIGLNDQPTSGRGVSPPCSATQANWYRSQLGFKNWNFSFSWLRGFIFSNLKKNHSQGTKLNNWY